MGLWGFGGFRTEGLEAGVCMMYPNIGTPQTKSCSFFIWDSPNLTITFQLSHMPRNTSVLKNVHMSYSLNSVKGVL